MTRSDRLDPKGLIHESFRIDGIDMADCRTIFLDWALSVEQNADMRDQIVALLERHSDKPKDHPMCAVLREGLDRADRPKRRGGWRSRTR
ncbi:MAG: hypothetical protein AAGA28_05665 [Pseudomonadota bacterium]